MKIVIDIDKEDWKDINDIHFIREDLKFKIGKAIMNGTPLPDGAEILTIDKRTFKAVTGRFVIYDREWLKEHFSTTEAYLYGGTRAAEQPEKRTEERTKTHACDCISRQALLNAISQKEYGHDYDENKDILGLKYVDIINGMPSVEPATKCKRKEVLLDEEPRKAL